MESVHPRSEQQDMEVTTDFMSPHDVILREKFNLRLGYGATRRKSEVATKQLTLQHTKIWALAFMSLSLSIAWSMSCQGIQQSSMPRIPSEKS
jgi:hypothetical protein